MKREERRKKVVQGRSKGAPWAIGHRMDHAHPHYQATLTIKPPSLSSQPHYQANHTIKPTSLSSHPHYQANHPINLPS